MMQMNSMSASRAKFLRHGAATLAALALAACQSLPPAPASAPQAQQPDRRTQVLREYGFEQSDEGWELQMSGKLLFDFDSDALQGQRRASVLKMGRALVEVGVQTLRVEGHTDDQGSDTYNERLSLRRAQAVAQALAEAGIERGHISVRGYGRSRPLVTSGPEGARKENRRVAIIVPAQ